MFVKKVTSLALGALLYAPEVSGFLSSKSAPASSKVKRQYLPAQPNDVKTIFTPSNVTITYKEPGKSGLCETTPGVNSYSGYVQISPDVNVFFWFFESRRDPAGDPVTLWLNGGPGSDSLIGLFQELGPCNVTEDLKTQVNPYAWNEVSNMLFISQPVGVGFSYSHSEIGSYNNYTGAFVPATEAPPTGRYPVINATVLDTTELAAVSVWHVVQGFYSGLAQLDSEVKSASFNLFTESYDNGHYGPAFSKYFYDQNQLIKNGTTQGTAIEFNTLGIINGIVDERIQAPQYPEFTQHNTYGIQLVNETVYNYMKFAYEMPNGCRDQVDSCRQARASGPRTAETDAICSEAQSMCRDNVEGPYYSFGERGVYDIRHPYKDPTPPSYFEDLLNTGTAQQAIGVNLNYTSSNTDIYYAFQQDGDFVFDVFIGDLEYLLENGVRVSLIYGDADWICNWFGGQAVSLAMNFTNKAEFAAAGYVPMTVDGVEYGETRQYGNFSFTRVYEAGHEVPYYQPIAALALFNRTIYGMDIATGEEMTTDTTSTNGTATATHTESSVALPPQTSGTASETATATSTSTSVPRKIIPFIG